MTKLNSPVIVVDAGGTNVKIGFQARPHEAVANTVVIDNDVFRRPKKDFDAQVQKLLGRAPVDLGTFRGAIQGSSASFEGADPHAQQNFVTLLVTLKELAGSPVSSAVPVLLATNNKEIFLAQGAEPDANHVFSIYGRITASDLKKALHGQTGSEVAVIRDEEALRGGMFPTAAKQGLRTPFYVTFGTYMGGGTDTKRGAGLLEIDGDSAPVLSLLQKTEVPWLMPARAIAESYLARVTGQSQWPSEFATVFEKMSSALDYNWQAFQNPEFPSLLHGPLGRQMLAAGHLDAEAHVTLTVEEVADRAFSGDPRALAVFEDFGVAAGHILGHAAKLKEADGIVLAGGIAQAERFFLPALRRSMSEIVDLPVAVVENPRWAVLNGTAETGRRQLEMLTNNVAPRDAAVLDR